MTGPKARAVLDEAEAELARLERERARVRAEQYVRRRGLPEAARLDVALAELLGREELAEAAARLEAEAASPLEARRAVLWRRRLDRAFVDGAPEVRDLERAIEARVVAFEPEVAGARGQSAVRHVLRTAPERERRRQAFGALAPLSRAVEGDLRRLMALRDERARRRGHPGYVAAALERMDLTPGRVAAFLQALIRDTDDAYRGLLAERAAAAGLDGPLMPWDVEFLLDSAGGGDLAPDRFAAAGIVDALSAFVRDHGLEALTLGVTLVSCDIPYNGLCVPVDPPYDIRILASPRDGLGYYHTLVHELGHALHARFQEAPSRLFRDEPGAFNEAMGEVLAAFLEDPAWLAARGLGVREADAAVESFRRQRLAFVRLRTVRALCEYALYAEPGADGDEVLGRVEAEVLAVEADPTPRWAADAWYLSYPVYWQNYVLAAAVACQTAGALRAAWGGLYGRAEAFDSVRGGYWRPAATVPWLDKIATLTGAPLATGALVAEVGGREGHGHRL
jgi:hypothetical protein